MTTDRRALYDDEWVYDFARYQRRRNYLLGFTILFAAVLLGLFVLVFLTQLAPTDWVL